MAEVITVPKEMLPMSRHAEIRDQLVAAMPSLRAFAISLTGNTDRADDLVQDTVLRAWANVEKFQEGTNLNAWLFTILRNGFYSDHRKRVREVEDVDGAYAERLVTIPSQQSHLDLDDFRRALLKLSADQREALLLVAAQGFSYEEAAGICACAVGTIKSRVNRARSHLAELLGLADTDDLGTDGVVMAALQLAA
jgi:RNA polymerase sigma-70 factor (ECF subfamily)